MVCNFLIYIIAQNIKPCLDHTSRNSGGRKMPLVQTRLNRRLQLCKKKLVVTLGSLLRLSTINSNWILFSVCLKFFIDQQPPASFRCVHRRYVEICLLVRNIPFLSVPLWRTMCVHGCGSPWPCVCGCIYLVLSWCCLGNWGCSDIWELGVPEGALCVGFSFPLEDCNQEQDGSAHLSLSLLPKAVVHLVRFIC